MKQGNKKSTFEEVQQMRKLYQDGLSLSEIGRRFKRDHSVIGYWCKGYRQKGIKDLRRLPIKKEKKIIPCPPKVNDKVEEKIVEQDRSICIVCKKKKEDMRWIKTQYCSRNCWDKATRKEIKWSEQYSPKMSSVYRLKDEQ